MTILAAFQVLFNLLRSQGSLLEDEMASNFVWKIYSIVIYIKVNKTHCIGRVVRSPSLNCLAYLGQNSTHKTFLVHLQLPLWNQLDSVKWAGCSPVCSYPLQSNTLKGPGFHSALPQPPCSCWIRLTLPNFSVLTKATSTRKPNKKSLLKPLVFQRQPCYWVDFFCGRSLSLSDL